jgi:hypothetical protein
MASTSSNVNWSNVQVPIFSGENYDFWSIKMKTYFVCLHRFVGDGRIRI